jgi:hypothetical protein
VTLEEGTWAAWLYDVLQPHVQEVVVCNPRRNALLKEGSKSDKVDTRKLADLLRTGMLRPVYHRENGIRTPREWSWQSPSKSSASLRFLVVVDLFLGDAEFSQHLFVGDAFIVFQPLSRLIERLDLFRWNRLIVHGSVSKTAGQRTAHHLKQMNDGTQLLVWQLIEQHVGLLAFLCGVGFHGSLYLS